MDKSLHSNIRSIYEDNINGFLKTKKDICTEIETNDYMGLFKGQFNVLRETKFTHPQVTFEDKYSPFLLKLREKYSKRLTETIRIGKLEKESKEKFKVSSKSFLKSASIASKNYEEALTSLKEFSTAKMLKIDTDAKGRFEDFKKIYPKLITADIEKIFEEFNKFKNFCIQDLFGKKCLFDKNLTSLHLNFVKNFKSLKNYDISNYEKIYIEDLISAVKKVSNVVTTAIEMISNKDTKIKAKFNNEDLNSSFDGFTEEYIFELEKLNKYLNLKKVIDINGSTKPMDKNDINLSHFERDITNLIKSTQFICYNIRNPFFLDL